MICRPSWYRLLSWFWYYPGCGEGDVDITQEVSLYTGNEQHKVHVMCAQKPETPHALLITWFRSCHEWPHTKIPNSKASWTESLPPSVFWVVWLVCTTASPLHHKCLRSSFPSLSSHIAVFTHATTDTTLNKFAMLPLEFLWIIANCNVATHIKKVGKYVTLTLSL